MSIIKELKSQFSLIAWCPIKEHASLMAIATAKDLTPSEEITPKTLSLYDWNLENVDNCKNQVEETLLSGATSICWGLTAIPDNTNAKGLICVGLEDGTIQFYAPCYSEQNSWTLEQISSVKVVDSSIQSMCFNCHNDWTELCVGCKDGSVHLINIATITSPEVIPLTKPGMNSSEITHVCWNPKVSHIVCTSTASGHVIIWDIRQKAIWCELFDNNTSRISHVAWSPKDGLQLLTALDSDATPLIKLWDLRSSTSCPLAELSGHSKGVLDLIWNHDDFSFVLSTGRDNRILLWDIEKQSVLRDLTGCEEKKEIPNNAADFFTTIAHSASTPRRTQVLWNGFNPAVIATASTNGSIELFSIDEACMDSAFGSTPYSAVNGIENHFHGRVLTVTDLIRGDDIKSEIEEFETSMRSGNMKEYCEKMVSITDDKEENEIWSFMKCMFEEDARDALISYLGYAVKQSEQVVEETPEQVVEQPVPAVKSITAEDLFASAPMRQPEIESEKEPEIEPENKPAELAEPAKPAMAVKESAEWREELKQCIIVGDFVNAVATCFKYHQFADAFVIASWGGAELVEQTTTRYMQEFASPIVRSMAMIVSGDLTNAIAETTGENWQETLAMILTYAKEEEFILLCQQLSKHLAALNETAAAILCSICAIDISSLIRLGLQFTKDMRIRSNLSIVEVILILCSMVAPQDVVMDEQVAAVSTKLGVLCKELKEQGMTSIQTKFLQNLVSVPSAQDLLQHIAIAHPDLLPGFVSQKVVSQEPVVPQQPVVSQPMIPQPVMPQPVMPQPMMPQPMFPQMAAPAPAPAPIQHSPRVQQAPKPFIPMQQPMTMTPAPQMPTPVAPQMPMGAPKPFIPAATPLVPVQPAPAPQPAPEPEPEIEYEITAEQQNVMDSIRRTIEMMNQVPLVASSKMIVSKEEDAIHIMEMKFKKGLISPEAMNLLMMLQEKLDTYDFVGAEDVYKKLNLEFWKLHKDWLMPLKHFLGLCKKMSSWVVC